MPYARVIGLALFGLLLALPGPQGLAPQGWAALALALLMAFWWLTEAVPLAATALLPLVLAPVLGLAPLDAVAPAYAHPLILLFLGGFLLARAVETSALHARIAHALLARAGTEPARVLAALMGATAFLSLWISNTASAMVMAPIAAAVAVPAGPRLAATLMLGVAFAATIGGMGSLIGTPPNAVFAAYAQNTLGIEIGFASWALVGVPVALVLLVVTWGWLARVFPSYAPGQSLPRPDFAPHPLRGGEARVAVIAAATALAWIARPWLAAALPGLPLTDAGIALAAALALFLTGDGRGGRLLSWGQAKSIRWDVLILFGGGLSLAQLIDTTGLAAWIGAASAQLSALPVALIVLAFAGVIVYLGELASNTAMAALFLPIAGASALALGVNPLTFMLPVALASSIGFMLPVATPPNAIVFAHPAVNRANMLRAGAPLDVIGIIVTVGLSALIGPLIG